MKIIIDIDEDLYECAIKDTYTGLDEVDAINAIKSGTELVTCKDCIWYRRQPEWDDAEEVDWVCDAFIDPPIRKPDDFCSRAKRRTKNEDL